MHRVGQFALIAWALTAAPPKDPCALLKPADIQALAPNATGAGLKAENDRAGTGCTYTWGPRTKEWGQNTLTLTVAKVSDLWPGGLSPNDVKQRVAVEVSSGGPGSSEVPGIGDGAAFTANDKAHESQVTAFFVKSKGVFVILLFHGGNALAQKDKLIALLKTAAAAL